MRTRLLAATATAIALAGLGAGSATAATVTLTPDPDVSDPSLQRIGSADGVPLYRVDYNAGVRFGGVVTNDAGQPVRARVTLVKVEGTRTSQAAGNLSLAAGDFDLDYAPLRNARVTAVVPAQPDVGIAAETRSASVEIRVTPELRFRKQAGGGRTLLRGRVYTGNPRSDGVVRLQRRAGGGFRTVRTLRPNKAGSFFYRLPAGAGGSYRVLYDSTDTGNVLDATSVVVRV